MPLLVGGRVTCLVAALRVTLLAGGRVACLAVALPVTHLAAHRAVANNDGDGDDAIPPQSQWLSRAHKVRGPAPHKPALVVEAVEAEHTVGVAPHKLAAGMPHKPAEAAACRP